MSMASHEDSAADIEKDAAEMSLLSIDRSVIFRPNANNSASDRQHRRSQSASGTLKIQHSHDSIYSSTRAQSTTQKHHFLQGVQLQNFHNSMDLPDPPTPNDNPPLRTVDVHGVAVSSPLRDIPTNSTSSLTPQQLLHMPQPNKRRTSMCHVASPVDLSLQADLPPLHGPNSTSVLSKIDHFREGESHKPSSSSGYLQASVTSGKKPPRSDRRKSLGGVDCKTSSRTSVEEKERHNGPTKRRRLLLPPSSSWTLSRSITPTMNAENRNVGCQQDPAASMVGSNASVQLQTSRTTPDPVETGPILEEVQELVRSYTSHRIGLDSDRRDGDQAADESVSQDLMTKIHRLTGYVLTSPLLEYELTAPVVETLHEQNRRKLDLWLAMSGDFKADEAYKKSKTELVQQLTRARFDARVNGESFRYVDVDRNCRIPAHEYERRYREMLHGSMSDSVWADYFDRLRLAESASERISASTRKASLSESIDEPQVATSAKHIHDNGATVELDLSSATAQTVRQCYNDTVPGSTDRLGGSSGVSSSVAEPPNPNKQTDHSFNTADADFLLLNQKGTDKLTNGPGIHPANDTVSEEMNTPSARLEANSMDSSSMELLLPSRDTISPNAAVARAEKRLWDAIDAALEAYSQEVLEIQKAMAEDNGGQP
jgi:hypothetical protein